MGDLKTAEELFSQALDSHRRLGTASAGLGDALSGMAMVRFGGGSYQQD